MEKQYLRCEQCHKKFVDPRTVPGAKVIVGRNSYLASQEHKTMVTCCSSCGDKFVAERMHEYNTQRTKQKLVYRCHVVWFTSAR